MLGIHVKKVSSVLEPPNRDRKTIAEAIEVDCSVLGLDSVQVFSHGPRNHNRNFSEKDMRDIRKLSKKVCVSVHSSYPSVAIWKLTHVNKGSVVSKRIINHIRDQLECCVKMGAVGLVVHISRKTIDVIREAMEVVEPVIKEIGVPIWLEMISSRAHEDLTYETPKKINRLVKALENIDPNVWGLCVDTAHVWGSGTDISTYVQMEAWFTDLSCSARKKISIFHLNGSSSDMGSGKDKHEIAFCDSDQIYRGYKAGPGGSGVRSIIKYCAPRHIPVILEINRGLEADAVACIDIIAAMEK